MFLSNLNDSCRISAYFGPFLSFSKVSHIQAFIIHKRHSIEQSAEQRLRKQFLLFHSVYNTLQHSFTLLNDLCRSSAYFGPFLSYSKVSQVQACIIQNWQDIQQRPVHHHREHFLLFHSIYNILQCFFPDLYNSHPIFAPNAAE